MILASNRGPFRFASGDDGTSVVKRGAGGLAGALAAVPGAADEPITWVARTFENDGAAAGVDAEAPGGVTLAFVDVEPRLAGLHYDVMSNGVLWFLHHGLFDLPRRPRFDRHLREAWEAYRTVNRIFAERVAQLATDGETALVQDYHLALVPGMLRDLRPDLRVAHFTHTPFCGPSSIRVLPTDISRALCASMAEAPCGFHTRRWARAYEASTHEVLGEVAHVEAPFVAPLGANVEALAEAADSPAAHAEARALDELVGDRLLLLRSDRIDPAKNIVRGFAAYGVLLDEHREWRERVVFVAMLNVSRERLPAYLAYRQEVERAASLVNEQWGTREWQPVVLDIRDDFARNVAGLIRYDVLLVNSLRDGLNLVAKEGPLVNRHDGVLCLSPETGAYDELGEAALAVHPYDLDQTAAVLHEALAVPADERAARAGRLRQLAGARTPRDWLADQLSHASPARR